ncbi:MAG: (2Fe-2S)-binding protein [Parachlamydiales bacterium]|nr:(2Fe-2S)-binding protein [Parachlamydiales bacterium]
MARLVFVDQQEEFDLEDGSSIREACEGMGVPFACSEGICGSCTITVLEGMENLSEYTEAEQDFLGDQNNERLACQCHILKGTVSIKI